MLNHSVDLVDRYPRVTCTNCGVASPASQQLGKFIDDGVSFRVDDFGHYGGFFDNFPRSLERDSLAHLCHDCCVILFNALPGLAQFAGVRGGHPNITGGWCFSGGELSHIENGTEVPPCCPYAWTWDRSSRDEMNNSAAYLATPELTWELRPAVEYETWWKSSITSEEEETI